MIQSDPRFEVSKNPGLGHNGRLEWGGVGSISIRYAIQAMESVAATGQHQLTAGERTRLTGRASRPKQPKDRVQIVTGWQIVLAVVAAVVIVVGWMAIFARRVFVRAPFRMLLGLLYRRKVVGIENLPKEGGCVVVSNHVSWIDGLLILWMLPRNVRFIVDGENFDPGYRQYLAGAFDTIMMKNNPKSIGRALKTAREGVKSGDVVGLFPEGTITRTGQLQTFKPGLKNVLKGTNAVVVPMCIDGMWGSIFSFSEGRFFRSGQRSFAVKSRFTSASHFLRQRR